MPLAVGARPKARPAAFKPGRGRHSTEGVRDGLSDQSEIGGQIASTMGRRSDELAGYYIKKRDMGRELQVNVVILGELQRVLHQYGESELAAKIEANYERHASVLQGGRGPGRN